MDEVEISANIAKSLVLPTLQMQNALAEWFRLFFSFPSIVQARDPWTDPFVFIGVMHGRSPSRLLSVWCQWIPGASDNTGKFLVP